MRAPLALALLLAPLAAAAQDAPGSAPPQPGTQESCVDVQIGSARSYDCLNRQLGAVVARTQRFSSDTDAPYNARSAPNVTGQYDRAATRERLGNAFGHSAIAQRPDTTYVNPVTHH